MIEINHVTKAFGDKTVLDNITVAVADGSIYGLVGYNGAGKTTLLNLIAGLYRPDGGNITADTENGKLAVYGSERVRRDLFLIPDDPYVLPQASLSTMAAFYRGFYPGFSMETMEKLTEIFGLDPKKKLNGFSKGMKRQAAIILGLSSRARYLLLDESFDGLDPNIRMTVCDLLMEYMAETGATIIMASHNLHEIEHICDTVGMLNGTHIVYSCEIEAIKERYTRIRAAFDREVDETALAGITYGELNACGKVLSFVSETPADTVEVALRVHGGLCLFETYPLSLEEVFKYEMKKGGKSYDIEGLFGSKA
ncbi:MAG: ABC transporter ATP-binding protein [Clostridia bacterium]|nr:ABC transporter ATP-binding protein [Clostridia bacterium]